MWRGGGETRFGGTKRLQSVSDFGFDDLFGLRFLIFDAVAFDKRSAEIRFRRAVSPRQRDLHADAICRIILRGQISQRIKITADRFGGTRV